MSPIEIYEDMRRNCVKLFQELEPKMGGKIEFFMWQPSFGGYYYSGNEDAVKKGLPFYMKFFTDYYLRIYVCTDIFHKSTVGERLAALSDFYEEIKEDYCMPTMFYTTKDDDEESLIMEWSFTDKEEVKNAMLNGTYFDDEEVDKLIFFEESCEYPRLQEIRDKVSENIGLPYEMLPLVDENASDYFKFKIAKYKGKHLSRKINE